MARGIDKADVLAALTAEAVLLSFSVDYQRAGREFRFRDCPECGARNRPDSVSVSVSSGRWRCLAHGCKGDLLDMIAGYLRIDADRSFQEVLAKAADIAGIPATDAPEAQAAFRVELEKRRKAQAEREAEAQKWRLKRQREAIGIWGRLRRTSEPGLAYLRRRGVEKAAAEVRYGRESVCVPLWRDGEIVNVVGRLFVEPGERPKIRGLAGCTTRGTFGNVWSANRFGGPVVIVEGLMDYLSARVIWPQWFAIGAHGAGQLAHVAEVVAEVVTSRGALVVPHDDDAGRKESDKAVAVLTRAGVDPDRIEWSFVKPPANDLNDHLMAEGRAA